MAKVNPFLCYTTSAQFTGAGTAYPIKTAAGVYYIVYVEVNTTDLVFRKSTDGGITWSAPTVIRAGTVVSVATWYDRWSNISAGLIHCAYTDGGANDTFYRTIDTENSDTLSTETTIFNGASDAAGGALSITRSRGGNVYCKTMIDAGSEGGFFKLLNANVPNGAWEAALTDTEALATTDQWHLVPGSALDDNDIMCIFYDASALGLSRYVYDDSANSWAEGAIIADGSITLVAASSNYPHFSVAVDLTNSQILVVAWNAIDAANQDLLGFTVTESAITAFTTAPVSNATDDCGFAGIAIDTATQDWYVYYGGKSDGSDTFTTSLSLNYKVSTDDGATWGAETDLPLSGSDATGARLVSVGCLFACPRFDTRQIVYFTVNTSGLVATVDEPAAAAGGGAVRAQIIGG